MAVVCNNCLTIGGISFLVTLYLLVSLHFYLYIKYVMKQSKPKVNYIGTSTYVYKYNPDEYSDTGNQVEGKDVATSIVRAKEQQRMIAKAEQAAAKRIEEEKKPWVVTIKRGHHVPSDPSPISITRGDNV